jgi:hypothetical protein
MPQSPLVTPQLRNFAAVVALAVTVVFLAVAVSQLLVGAGTDPRDSLGSRAAGFGFTDRAHQTLFGAIPLALPLLAALISQHPTVRLLAVIEYAALLLTGAVISVAAFDFGLDVAARQRESDLTAAWIDDRAAIEFLATDMATLLLVAVASAVALRAWRRVRVAAAH